MFPFKRVKKIFINNNKKNFINVMEQLKKLNENIFKVNFLKE
jgi:hypothetical protein